MRSKAQLLTTVGIIFLVIGVSFMAGTVYRSSITTGASLGFSAIPYNQTVEYRSVMTYALSPRDLSMELTTNATVDLYLLDSEGIKLWRSEGTIKPIWVAKDAATQTFLVPIPSRDNYGFLFFSTNNSTATVIDNLRIRLFGYERDLLWFSLTFIAIGSVITATSRIMLLKGNKKAVSQQKRNLGVLPKDTLSNPPQPKINLNKPKPTNQLRKLLAWELEEYLAFPIIEVVILIAIFTVLTPTIIETSATRSYSNLLSGIQTIFLFLIFVAGALFCHSYAGSLSKGETKLILSYPVQRSHLFLAKFTALFTVLFAVYAGVFALQIYLLTLSPFEPLFYASLLFVALQLLLVCTISTALSVVTKNEMLSILVSALMLFGIENIAARVSLVSFTGRFTTGFAFVSQQVHGVLPRAGVLAAPPMGDALLSVLVTIGISAFLFVFSYIYYTRKMEID
jgi:ABC-type transport system involved in multi-copper enzyme maturation permease subunit